MRPVARWAAGFGYVVLVFGLLGAWAQYAGPPHPVGYVCYYDEVGLHCSPQPPGWFFGDQA